MSLRNFITFTSITAFVFSAPLIVFPQLMASSFAVTLDDGGMLFARNVGAILLGVGFINWSARDWGNSKPLKDLLIGNLAIQILTGVTDIVAIFNGIINTMGWIGVAVHVILGAGFLYYYKKL